MATDYSPWSAEYSFKTPEDEGTGPPPSGGDTRLSDIFFFENFEGGGSGQSIESFSDLNACTTATVRMGDHYPGAGSRCMESTVRAGTSGWNEWGYSMERGWPSLQQNTEVWFRTAIKFPSDFQNKSDPRLKMLRLGKVQGSNNRGYVDNYMDGRNIWATVEVPGYSNPDNPDWCRSNTEDDPPTGWHCTSSPNISWGEWFMLEIYSYNHHTAIDLGGKGHVKVWLNGALIIDGTGFGTLRDDGSRMNRVLCNTIWNYWGTDSNGERSPSVAPLTQTNWYDQVAIAVQGGGRNDRQYLDTDADGFPFIGLAVQ